MAALACHSEFILPTNFTNVYRCAIGFSPTDYTDFIDFLFSLYDSLFCFAKIALWIYTDFIAARWFFANKFHKYHEYLLLCDSFFSADFTEWTHEPCVPTGRGCVYEYFFVIL